MSSRMLDACLLSLALVLASCTQAPGDNAPGSGDAAAEGATASDPALDEPSEEVPPAIAPAATAPDFTGFGPVPFGAEAQALKRALGGSLEEGATESPDACHYLFPQPRPEQGQGTTFMIEGRRFVRVDTDDPATTAPGGGRIGMSVDEVAALYPGLSASPHKYVEGAQSLRVTGDGSDAVLLFEADAQGRVQEWRIGLPPQVDYVERCG